MGSPLIWFGNAAKFLKSQLVIPGSTSGTLTIQPSASTTSYSLTMPSAQGGASTFLQNDGSGGLSWSSPAGTPGLISKNYLINSAFDYWQRYGSSPSQTIANGSSTYVADRWYVKNSLGTNGVITFSQTSGTVSGSKFAASVKITTAPTVGQTNGTELYQTVENISTLELLSQSISFSINIKALGNVNQVGLQFFYNTSEAKVNTSLGSETTVSVNTSTFTLGSLNNISVSTTPTTSGVVGVRIRITGVSSGNTYDLNNGFIVEQGMMNIGTTAATFARAGITPSEELIMCQRFYEKSYDLTTAPGASPNFAGTSGGLTSSTGLIAVVYKATKRVTGGTITIYNPNTGATGSVYDNTDRAASVGSTSGNTSAGQTGFLIAYSGNSAFGGSGHWTVDAEI